MVSVQPVPDAGCGTERVPCPAPGGVLLASPRHREETAPPEMSNLPLSELLSPTRVDAQGVRAEAHS